MRCSAVEADWMLDTAAGRAGGVAVAIEVCAFPTPACLEGPDMEAIPCSMGTGPIGAPTTGRGTQDMAQLAL